jgi:hypothetical protein
MISKRVLLVTVCVVTLIVAVGAYGYALYSEISGLKDQIDLINQELEELWEEINTLKVGNSTNDTMNFTFIWGPETQSIVQGTLRLEVSLTWGVVPNSTHKWLSMVVKVNDDDYSEWDYLGLVFDMNENGVIDLGFEDAPFGLWTNNMTAPSVLLENGFLAFAETMPTPGPHTCTFDPDTGYTFRIFFPSPPWTGSSPLNPAEVLKEGHKNLLHICFRDTSGGGVFVRFVFLAHAGGD